MTLLNTLLRSTNYQNPFLRTLIPSIATAFALQTAVAIPSILGRSEKYYDISGSLTHLSVVALSLYLPTLRARAAAASAATAASGSTKLPAWPSLLAAFTGNGGSNNGLNWRQVVVTTALSVWAVRLGTYLYNRISTTGSDSRFDSIKTSPPKFLAAFLAQATWVSIIQLPVLAINSIPHSLLSTLPLITFFDILGLSLFIGGFAIEVIADKQRDVWLTEKRKKIHDDEFMMRGLWGKSRHPNYFGETMLWSGVATVAAGVLAGSVGLRGMGLSGMGVLGRALGVGICAVSPVFTGFLLLKVSGVPLSEEKYDRRYGDRKDYQEWKKNTPMFIPKL